MQRRAQITNAFKGAQRNQALVFCSSVQRPDVTGEPTSYPQADGRRSRRWGHINKYMA
jgi:hypothetical protein